MMRSKDMQGLLDAVFEALPPTNDFEFFVEVDTTNISESVINCLLGNGMTRAVVGVQDFNPLVQQTIGRHQSFDQTLDIVRQMRNAGLRYIDMEMLYGLPRQSTRSIAETAQQVLALDPDRIAVSEYAHLPNIAKRQMMIDARTLPKAEDAYAMSRTAHQILLSDGYEPLGIDHFARPGDPLLAARDRGLLHRDFQGYSDNASHALIGFGASAISRFPQGYVQNASATSVYAGRIETGQLAGHRGYHQTATDQVVAFMIEMLMCRFELKTDVLKAKFPSSAAFVSRAIETLHQSFAPFLDLPRGEFVIKPMAYPLARVICNALDEMGQSEAMA